MKLLDGTNVSMINKYNQERNINKVEMQKQQLQVGDKQIEEMEEAIAKTKIGKAPGSDQITADILKAIMKKH